MKVIEKFADKVISSGAYKPLDRVYVINKIRGLVVERSLVAASHMQLCVLIVVYAACVAVHYISEYGVY